MIFLIYVSYFQALSDNMALTRYKEVYAAAAEVLGLILQYIAEKENVRRTCFLCVMLLEPKS